MDYQRTCGCRMGRTYATPVYRTAQMNNAQLRSCDMPDQRAHQHMNERQKDGYANCCGDNEQNYPSLAIVTSPSQVWQKLFSPCDAMAHGTLFCELYKPLVGCKTGGRMR